MRIEIAVGTIAAVGVMALPSDCLTRRSTAATHAKPKKPIAMPAAFKKAIDKSAKARATFDSFPPSHQREYLQWITEAKQDATRDRRIAQAVEWLSAGKPRNWKYMK